jgi:hypothetical protein
LAMADGTSVITDLWLWSVRTRTEGVISPPHDLNRNI